MNIWIVGYPKSGNTWLTLLLADALDAAISSVPGLQPLAHNERAHTEYTVCQAHLQKRQDAGPVVHLYRDPRDVIISAYHYWQMEEVDRALDCVLDGGKPIGISWADHMARWHGRADAAISYERLHGDTPGALSSLLDQLGLTRPAPCVQQAVERNRFEERLRYVETHGDTLPHGAAVQRRLLRAGRIGDWRYHLNAAQVEHVHARLRAWLLRLHYLD